METEAGTARAGLVERAEARANKIRRLFTGTVDEVVKLCRDDVTLQPGEMFSIAGMNRRKRKEAERLLLRLHSLSVEAVRDGVRIEWEEANKAVDGLLSKEFGKGILSDPAFTGWTHHNTAAAEAFLKRGLEGQTISDRLWTSVQRLRAEMEVAVTVSIGEGVSAQRLSRRVRQYLEDPDLMFRRFRYKDDLGEWRLKWKKKYIDEKGRTRFEDYERDDFKTGPGVYKSAYKNAMRLARTETNSAYRTADHDRMQRLDFVLGQRINLVADHPKRDICDTLAGDYPKDFLFTGWHPQCFCFVTFILPSHSEMMEAFKAHREGRKYTPGGMVSSYPAGFTEYVNGLRTKDGGMRNPPRFITENPDATFFGEG